MVDGIRHLEAVSSIRKLVEPLELILVYVATDERIRRERYISEHGDLAPLDTFEKHASEKQVKHKLKSAGNLIVDGAILPEANAARILELSA